MKKFVVRVLVLLAGTMATAAPFGFTSAQSANAVTPRLSPEIRQGPRVLKPSDYGVGRYVQDLAFTDLDGQERRLSDFEDQAALVLVLTGTGCPISMFASRRRAPKTVGFRRSRSSRRSQRSCITC